MVFIPYYSSLLERNLVLESLAPYGLKEVSQDTFKEGCQLNERASVSTSIEEAVLQ